MNDELLMGVDIGTSYSKGVVTTLGGEIVARASRAHDVSMPRPDDPQSDWSPIVATVEPDPARRT